MLEWLKSLFRFLKTVGEKPSFLGSFHIISLILVAIVTVVFCLKYKELTEKTARRILFWVSLIVIIFEIYKQLVYCVNIVDNEFVFQYKWHIFPWQFCSTPMFVGMAAALIKNEKIHKALSAYLASFSLAAGVIVCVYPSTAYSRYVGINIQTTVCHGSMILLGVLLLTSGYVKPDKKSFKGALVVFIAGLAVAFVLNYAAYYIGIPEGDVFNMYFISPFFPNDVPVIAPIRKLFPDPFFPLIYIAVFSVAAKIFFLLVQKLKK